MRATRCCPTSLRRPASAPLPGAPGAPPCRRSDAASCSSTGRYRLTRVWPAPAAVALIEQHHARGRRIEQPPVPTGAPRPGTAVHDDRGTAVRVATGLPIHLVAVTDREHAGVVGLDPRKQARHRSSVSMMGSLESGQDGDGTHDRTAGKRTRAGLAHGRHRHRHRRDRPGLVLRRLDLRWCPPVHLADGVGSTWWARR